MNRTTKIGLLIGTAAGVIDLIPMLMQGLPIEADISAFSMWVAIGYLLSVASIAAKGIIKGLLISFLVLLPNLFIIGWKEPLPLVPVILMTAVLGSMAGYFYERFTRG